MTRAPIPLHAQTHLPDGQDPLIYGPPNDWVYASTAIGTVSSGSGVVQAGFSSITYQTDDGSIYGVDTSGAYDAISMLAIGTYLVRVGALFPANRTGTIEVSGVIGGDVTTYDYDVRAGTTHYDDIAPGSAWWEQLCIVNDLASPAGVFVSFEQTTGSDMIGVVGYAQIFRLT